MREIPVLPSLQEIHLEMYKKDPINCPSVIVDSVDTSFFNDLLSLQDFGCRNTETVGALLFSFFKHFAFDFDFNRHVISVRCAKYIGKIEKGWHEGDITGTFIDF